MTILQQVEARNAQWRQEEIQRTEAWKKDEIERADKRHRETLDWQRKVEENVGGRFGTQLVVQALIAFLATAATFIAAKLLPFPWLH